MPDADQTPNNKEKKNSSDLHPGVAACIVVCHCVIMMTFFGLTALYAYCLLDGAECNVQFMTPGRGVVARLLAVIEDLEQAHATFQRREKEDGTSVILQP